MRRHPVDAILQGRDRAAFPQKFPVTVAVVMFDGAPDIRLPRRRANAAGEIAGGRGVERFVLVIAVVELRRVDQREVGVNVRRHSPPIFEEWHERLDVHAKRLPDRFKKAPVIAAHLQGAAKQGGNVFGHFKSAYPRHLHALCLQLCKGRLERLRIAAQREAKKVDVFPLRRPAFPHELAKELRQTPTTHAVHVRPAAKRLQCDSCRSHVFRVPPARQNQVPVPLHFVTVLMIAFNGHVSYHSLPALFKL